MSGFWILTLIFSTMYTVQPGRLWVTAQSTTESAVYQPDKELSVNIGDSATLRCCISDKEFGMMAWFKQPNRKKPQLIIKFFKTGEDVSYYKIEKSRIQIKRSLNCFNMTILNIIQSDEAMYYCALLVIHDPVFGDGTYLKMKETSKSVVCDCKPPLHGNTTNINTQNKTVLGLGTALGLCALLIFSLTYFLLRRRKCDLSESFSQKESEVETLNYAALKFSKRKSKAEERRTGSSDECVYATVKKMKP